MWSLLRNLPLAMCLSLAGFGRKFQKDERGLSGVVVAVMLILVAVLAVAIIWSALSGWLTTLWERITSEGI